MSSDHSANIDPVPVPSVKAATVRTDTLLIETLIHLLIEKGLLTKNDALSVVETVAQVQQGVLEEEVAKGASSTQDMHMLRRMYDSLGMLDERPSDRRVQGENIVQLRPPVHGDHPEFPLGK